MPDRHEDVIARYCLDCHDSETTKGQVDLEDLSFDLGSDVQAAERWQEVLNAINAGDMPPPKKLQMSADEKTEFLADLSETLVNARKIYADTGGEIKMRRLNQREYANTIEALLGVRPNVDGLPNDRAGSGFDTAGASLYFSSDQFEQYVEIARAALEQALVNDEAIPKETIRVEAERGRIRSVKGVQDQLATYHDVAKRSNQFKADPNASFEELEFRSAAQARNAGRHANRVIPILEKYLQRPEVEHGTIMWFVSGHGAFGMNTPHIIPEPQEEYTIRARAAAYPDVPARFHYIEFFSINTQDRKAQRTLGWRKVKAPIDEPEIIEFTVTAPIGETTSFGVRNRTHPKGSKNDAKIYLAKGMPHTPPGIWLDWVEVERSGRPAGPTPEAAEIFFPRPEGQDEKTYAREVIKRFATRAFRTVEPDDEYLDKLLQRFEANRARGQDLRESLLQPLSIVLASPTFLYMVESTGNQRLTDPELAVRLSYFLWSAPPDSELLAAAKEAKLSDPGELRKQTSRLLSDKRADRFVRDFTYQWLGMDRLGMFPFNTLLYPEIDNAVMENSREEIYQMIRHVLDEKRPLLDLLKSDYLLANDIMADYYGISHVEGHEFNKVSLPDGSPRGGLLSTAAVLAMGSDGTRSSPVERGVWVLRHILNDPPPPAPPNVPQLDRIENVFQPARDKVKAHQEAAQCTNCHRKIDPIGYGMENFDAAGLWRVEEVISERIGRKNVTESFPIDPSGELATGTKFEDFDGLRDIVANQVDDFARNVAEAIIAYGLGRPYGFTDHDLAEELLKKSKPSDYALDQFIHALIQTETFQSK
ncbi:DUF1592 domain-containing protein [Verrucomicrobiales bacterium]|nr:DUF1592 domain-containing protein [Verrucomicrobiales bacterium]